MATGVRPGSGAPMKTKPGGSPVCPPSLLFGPFPRPRSSGPSSVAVWNASTTWNSITFDITPEAFNFECKRDRLPMGWLQHDLRDPCRSTSRGRSCPRTKTAPGNSFCGLPRCGNGGLVKMLMRIPLRYSKNRRKTGRSWGDSPFGTLPQQSVLSEVHRPGPASMASAMNRLVDIAAASARAKMQLIPRTERKPRQGRKP